VGCVRRLGCLVVLVALAAAAWVTRDRWGPHVPPEIRNWIPGGLHASAAADSAAPDPGWRSVTSGGASHAEHLILALANRSGPPYTSLLPSDFAAFMLMDVAGRVPPPEDSTQATILDRRLALRTSLDIKALGGRTAFGPLGGVLADREPLTLAGSLDVVRPGVAEFRVEQLTVKGVPVPSALIPELVHKVEAGPHPAGLAADALLLNVPPYVADIRIAGNRVAVYRSVP
jgi:hypothetical protein